MDFLVEPAAVGGADVTVPGDKSISHRALMLGSIAEGDTDVSGFLAGEDCLATLAAFRQLGVTVDRHSDTALTVRGVGKHGLTAPGSEIDLGNSGTAMRLMCGLLAGQGFASTLVGDASLSSRPMNRVIRPLAEMGAKIESQYGRPPLEISPAIGLAGIEYELPVASAQVKSCLLLAGLYADGTTSVFEPAVTRDHTERMLATMGASVSQHDGWVRIDGKQRLTGTGIDVPADLSSATFLMLAATLSPKADVLIRNVGINPTRAGVLRILKDMGADLTLENKRDLGEEPVADIRVRSAKLVGGDVDPGLVSLAIDEFPALFVAAAAATGRTRFTGLGELRVKESDRIAAMAAGLRALGIEVEEFDDGAEVEGGKFSGGVVESRGDHRIAMSLAIAGSIAEAPVTVRGVDAVDTSFPGFADLVSSMGMQIEVRDSVGASG